MTTTSVSLPVRPAPPPRTVRTGRRVVGSVMLVALVIGVVLAVGVGFQRMFRAAPLDSVDAQTGQVVTGYRWSSWPLGFTVRYADGSQTTHLWW